MKETVISLKRLLTGGTLCCLTLWAAYAFQHLCVWRHVEAFSSSVYFVMWLFLFVGTLLWTLRTEKEHSGIAGMVDWQFVCAYLLIVADRIYLILPKEIHRTSSPSAWSGHIIPALIVVGVMVAFLIKLSVRLSRKLSLQRTHSKCQMQEIQQLLNAPSVQRFSHFRRLIENRSIGQFSKHHLLLLLDECKMIDPEFFSWLRTRRLNLSSRDIIFCVLIRMYKTADEIVNILGLSEGGYRTMKSRLKTRLLIREDADCGLEEFLRTLPQ